jgi:hypothetical protein
MLITLFVMFALSRLSLRANLAILGGMATLALLAHWTSERYMNAATNAHLDHVIGTTFAQLATLVCSPFESAACPDTVQWLLAPVRLSLKPLAHGLVVLAEWLLVTPRQ